MSKHKARSPSRARRPRFRAGDNAVCTTGKLAGVDPFTRLVVTTVHKDGTVDVARDDTGTTFTHVNPADLVGV